MLQHELFAAGLEGGFLRHRFLDSSAVLRDVAVLAEQPCDLALLCLRRPGACDIRAQRVCFGRLRTQAL